MWPTQHCTPTPAAMDCTTPERADGQSAIRQVTHLDLGALPGAARPDRLRAPVAQARCHLLVDLCLVDLVGGQARGGVRLRAGTAVFERCTVSFEKRNGSTDTAAWCDQSTGILVGAIKDRTSAGDAPLSCPSARSDSDSCSRAGSHAVIRSAAPRAARGQDAALNS